jgi:cytochrome b561
MDQLFRFSRITVGLHWIIAITMMALLFVGLYMVENEAWHLYHLHKSIGILIFPVVLLRVLWRLKTGWPVALTVQIKWQQTMAKIAHYILLIITILMPVSGMIFSAASGHGFGIFSWEIWSSNPSISKPGEVDVRSVFWSDLGHSGHELLGNLLLLVLFLHLLGALKHHFIDKDGVLKRMLGMRVG